MAFSVLRAETMFEIAGNWHPRATSIFFCRDSYSSLEFRQGLPFVRRYKGKVQKSLSSPDQQPRPTALGSFCGLFVPDTPILKFIATQRGRFQAQMTWDVEVIM